MSPSTNLRSENNWCENCSVVGEKRKGHWYKCCCEFSAFPRTACEARFVVWRGKTEKSIIYGVVVGSSTPFGCVNFKTLFWLLLRGINAWNDNLRGVLCLKIGFHAPQQTQLREKLEKLMKMWHNRTERRKVQNFVSGACELASAVLTFLQGNANFYWFSADLLTRNTKNLDAGWKLENVSRFTSPFATDLLTSRSALNHVGLISSTKFNSE